MEEIWALQAKLAQVQEEKSNNISERVVVEIVQKLLQQQYVQLIYTRDGQEYITPDKLVAMIKALVMQHHKLSMNQLPDLLNVNF